MENKKPAYRQLCSAVTTRAYRSIYYLPSRLNEIYYIILQDNIHIHVSIDTIWAKLVRCIRMDHACPLVREIKIYNFFSIHGVGGTSFACTIKRAKFRTLHNNITNEKRSCPAESVERQSDEFP